MNETQDTWNKVAPLYEQKFMPMDFYNVSYDAFIASLPERKARILDIGCGPGIISRYLAASLTDADITGIDYALEMIKLARVNVPSGRFEVMDCRHVSALQGPFDGIICGFCLPFLTPDECRQFIVDCAALLVQGGVFYLSFVDGDPACSDWLTGSAGSRVFFNYHPAAELATMLEEQGFGKMEKFEINYPKGDGQFDLHTVLLAQLINRH